MNAVSDPKNVSIYTDGACIGNPGPGGYGVVLLYKGHRRELSGGYRQTTNNRMELFAAIVGLEALKQKCRVTLNSDSQYLIKAIDRGWAKKWRANGWKRNRRESASNPDLWERILDLCEYHQVEFKWIRGHSGHLENERCDELALEAAKRPNLDVDEGYHPQPATREYGLV